MPLGSIAQTAVYACSNSECSCVVAVPDTLSLFVGEEEDEGNPVLSETHIQF